LVAVAWLLIMLYQFFLFFLITSASSSLHY
jgi:hypothetical protein